jgi:acetate kinase
VAVLTIRIERLLTVNSGSSSLKLRLLDAQDTVVGSVDLPPPAFEDSESLLEVLHELGPFDAVGHRVVHGGTRFEGPVLIDADVIEQLERLIELAPLHQPKSLAGIRAVAALLPNTPAVACFDTAFHLTIGPEAATYALPEEWRRRWPLRRYGFHGLSHAYAARRAAEIIGVNPMEFRVVTCHLGGGASLAAVRSGKSVDTTMGFTPLDGLVMATRSGTVDPGLILWLQIHAGIEPRVLSNALERDSGLLGLAGTADMREVIQRATSGDAKSLLALDVYIHRLRLLIGSMAAALNGVDALVFTGGVGENAAELRWRACEGLRFLGIMLDAAANAGKGDRQIGRIDALPVLVIEAREDLEMARQVRAVVNKT